MVVGTGAPITTVDPGINKGAGSEVRLVRERCDHNHAKGVAGSSQWRPLDSMCWRLAQWHARLAILALLAMVRMLGCERRQSIRSSLLLAMVAGLTMVALLRTQSVTMAFPKQCYTLGRMKESDVRAITASFQAAVRCRVVLGHEARRDDICGGES